VDAPAFEWGRRSRVERRRFVSAGELARAVDRPAERVYDPAFPGSVRRQRQIVRAIGASSDCRVAVRIERFERGRGVVDPDDFPDLNAIADVDADTLAQFEKARQARHAIVRHRNLDDDAADSCRLQIPQSPRHALLQTLERWHGGGSGTCGNHWDDPRVLIAS
jgi:hypothetical protein